jgi:hypothetical protein
LKQAYQRWSRYCENCPHAKPIEVEDIHETLVLLTQYEPAELEVQEIQDQVFRAFSHLDFQGVSMVRWNRHRFVIWLFAIWEVSTHIHVCSAG